MQTGTGSIEEFQDWPCRAAFDRHCASFTPFVCRGVTYANCFTLSILKNLASEWDVDVACSARSAEFSGDERKSESISMVCYSRNLKWNLKWNNINVCLFFSPSN